MKNLCLDFQIVATCLSIFISASAAGDDFTFPDLVDIDPLFDVGNRHRPRPGGRSRRPPKPKPGLGSLKPWQILRGRSAGDDFTFPILGDIDPLFDVGNRRKPKPGRRPRKPKPISRPGGRPLPSRPGPGHGTSLKPWQILRGRADDLSSLAAFNPTPEDKSQRKSGVRRPGQYPIPLPSNSLPPSKPPPGGPDVEVPILRPLPPRQRPSRPPPDERPDMGKRGVRRPGQYPTPLPENSLPPTKPPPTKPPPGGEQPDTGKPRPFPPRKQPSRPPPDERPDTGIPGLPLGSNIDEWFSRPTSGHRPRSPWWWIYDVINQSDNKPPRWDNPLLRGRSDMNSDPSPTDWITSAVGDKYDQLFGPQEMKAK